MRKHLTGQTVSTVVAGGKASYLERFLIFLKQVVAGDSLHQLHTAVATHAIKHQMRKEGEEEAEGMTLDMVKELNKVPPVSFPKQHDQDGKYQ